MSGLAVLLAVMAVPAVIAAAAVWGGFIASILWGWFMVPVFGLPPISIPAAIGLGLVASCFVASSHKERDDKTEAWAHLIGVLLAKPLLLLCIGWVAKGFL